MEGGPLLGIISQHIIGEILPVGMEFTVILHPPLSYFIQMPFIFKILEGLKYCMSYFDILKEDFLHEHLIEDHACAPDIASLGVALIVLVQIDLRASIQWGTHLSCHKNTASFSCQAEIADLDILVQPYENVIRLQISMHLPWIVRMLPLAFM